MSNKLTFEEWFNGKDIKCSEILESKQCPKECLECEYSTEAKDAWNFAQAQEQKEIEELKKKVDELAASAYSLAKENESLNKKLEKADSLARAFAKECPDSEKARAYLKENE